MNDAYEKIIFENEEKGFQYKLTVSEFRDVEYLHIRKYFLSYEGDYIPSNEGASFPATVENVFALLDGLLELVSDGEAVDAITEHFRDKLFALEFKPKV